MVSEDLIKRPLHLRKDFDQIVALLELAFAKEIEARGMDIRAELSNYKKVIPLFKVLGLFSKTFRYPMIGFVFKTKEGQIIASANTSSLSNRWEIAMVATHPDYRRRGLAKELVSDAIAFSKNKKAEMCVLEVIADNTPAYDLYQELGFEHYDSIAELKLESENFPSNTEIAFPKEYTLGRFKRDNQSNLQRYHLKIKETPKEVQKFLPVDKKRYNSSKLKNLLRPMMLRLFSININSWMVYFQEQLVGTIFVELNKSGKNPHRIELVIDPTHQGKLAKPMISYALSKINESEYTHKNSLISVRSTNTELMETLKEFGFSIVENNHKLGLRFKPSFSGYSQY